MTDPRILYIISFIFAIMAAYSLYTGVRQLRDARRTGQSTRWYKHLGLLTGIEYALLTFVFLLRTATLQNEIAPGMQSLVGTLYLILLIPAAIIAGLVIRRVILNMRSSGQANRTRASAAVSTHVQPQSERAERAPSRQDKDEQIQRQRARRKKAAAARRRQAGKA
ncbi:MAG TPA: hypothetical protein VF458_21495 [Ktedonobacteraceae bacterium]